MTTKEEYEQVAAYHPGLPESWPEMMIEASLELYDRGNPDCGKAIEQSLELMFVLVKRLEEAEEEIDDSFWRGFGAKDVRHPG